MDGTEEVESFVSYLHIGLNELLEESHIAAHIAESDHGSAVAHQGIVGIIPLGSQGIHPNAGIRNEVRELGEERDEQFIRHGSAEVVMYACLDAFMRLLVEPDTILRVSDYFGKGFDAIGDIGKGISSCV